MKTYNPEFEIHVQTVLSKSSVETNDQVYFEQNNLNEVYVNILRKKAFYNN